MYLSNTWEISPTIQASYKFTAHNIRPLLLIHVLGSVDYIRPYNAHTQSTDLNTKQLFLQCNSNNHSLGTGSYMYVDQTGVSLYHFQKLPGQNQHLLVQSNMKNGRRNKTVE